jgi:hypothetical protein
MHPSPILRLGEGWGTNSHLARIVLSVEHAPKADFEIGGGEGWGKNSHLARIVAIAVVMHPDLGRR